MNYRTVKKILTALLILLQFSLYGNEPLPKISEKALICGVCKNVEQAVPNTIASIERLGAQFSEYRVIIYENNSKDRTKELLSAWAKQNPKVLFLFENLSKKKVQKKFAMKRMNRTEMLAWARNRVLDLAMQKQYDDFKYIIWADLDFQKPWDIANIVDTILHPEQPWDAVFANGKYDLFALRDEQFPIGFELLGLRYWDWLGKIWKDLDLNEKGSWRKVYSAFGGLGIYQREALKGCRYSGVITRDLEQVMLGWLEKAKTRECCCFLKEYEALLETMPIFTVTQDYLDNRKKLPDVKGIRLNNRYGLGKIVYFSCTDKHTLPWTCEHLPLHASMTLKGRGRFFINPRLISDP